MMQRSRTSRRMQNCNGCVLRIEFSKMDLDLTTVVQNVAILSTSSVESSSTRLLRSISLTVIVLAMFELSHTLLLTSSGRRSSCADFRHVGLDTVTFVVPAAALRELGCQLLTPPA